MNRRKHTVMTAGAVLVILLLAASGAVAQAMFAQPGSFVILTPCQAFTSIRNQSGAVDLEVDRAYVALGENKAPGGTHVQIGLDGSRKWVSLECGDYEGQRPAFANPPTGGGTDPDPVADCLPFFDDKDNPVHVGVGGEVDITPEAPPIEPFGQAVNALCGSPGKVTGKAEFKRMMQDHPQVLADVMAYTGGKVFAGRAAHDDAAAYLDDLAEAWYGAKGFDHIFCGETKGSSSIGGLHYQGRYQQLQAGGDACRLANFSKNEVVPGSVYTMGAKMKRPSGAWAESDYKGYGLTLSAADLLKGATRAFVENPPAGNNNSVCILSLDDAGTPYHVVFVRRADGIRTFYPDATPDPGDPVCANPMALRGTGVGNVQPGGGTTEPKSLNAGRFRIEVISSDEKGVSLRISEIE